MNMQKSESPTHTKLHVSEKNGRQPFVFSTLMTNHVIHDDAIPRVTWQINTEEFGNKPRNAVAIAGPMLDQVMDNEDSAG